MRLIDSAAHPDNEVPARDSCPPDGHHHTGHQVPHRQLVPSQAHAGRLILQDEGIVCPHELGASHQLGCAPVLRGKQGMVDPVNQASVEPKLHSLTEQLSCPA